ncbi:MAG: AzlC family ABC transporter permease [Bacillota bacterium]
MNLTFSTSRNNLYRGLSRSIPVCLGYFPIGFVYGVMAAGVGLNPLETTLMSILVFAGSAQFIAVGMIGEQLAVITIALTTFLVNLRHLLMSAALAPCLGHLSRLQQALFAYQLTDETFALHSLDFRKEEKPPAVRIITTNMAAHLCWVAGSLAGVWTGGLLTDLEMLGLDFTLAAMFIFLLVIQITTVKYILVVLLAMLISLLLFKYLGGHWYIIITTLLAATAGFFLENRRATAAERVKEQ